MAITLPAALVVVDLVRARRWHVSLLTDKLPFLMVAAAAVALYGLQWEAGGIGYGVGLAGSWGQMIDQARDELSRTPIIWWNIAGASLALFTLVLSVNLIADAIRDILDPRTRREHQ